MNFKSRFFYNPVADLFENPNIIFSFHNSFFVFVFRAYSKDQEYFSITPKRPYLYIPSMLFRIQFTLITRNISSKNSLITFIDYQENLQTPYCYKI